MNAEGTWVIELAWAMTILTGLAVVIRVFVRASRRARSGFIAKYMTPSDVLGILAWLNFLLQTIGMTSLFLDGVFTMPTGIFSVKSLQYLSTTSLKWCWIEYTTYLNTMFFVKFAVLFLWGECIPRRSSKFVKWGLCFLWTLTVAIFALNSIDSLFLCLPFSRNWSHDPDLWCGGFHSVTNAVAINIGHILSDVLIYVFPLPIIIPFLRKPNDLSIGQKLGLGFSFLAGFLCVGFGSFTALDAVFRPRPLTTAKDKEILFLLFISEQTNAVLVLCCPAIVSIFLSLCDRRRQEHNRGRIFVKDGADRNTAVYNSNAGTGVDQVSIAKTNSIKNVDTVALV